MYKPEREKEILAFWKENQIFEKSLEQTKKGEPYVFYDGPPFATGLPHFGHILPTTLKDIVPRYQTMKGRFVPRMWGWDCHGLPIENLVEKKLGLKNKKEIEELGVETFNREARNIVMSYADQWKEIIPRLGRWVDMENDYRTMNPSYTESVWWSFKQFANKGLAYEGFRSMHLCPRCETTLSNFEVAQGYKDITDISVYAKFELKDTPNTFVLAWTTTPWTLPGNVALAVGADIDYVKVTIKDQEGEYVLAKERAEHTLKAYEYSVVKEIKGSELVGLSYLPVFDYYSSQSDLPLKENGWKIYAADFVTTTDGTGVVHIAPAFGEDDLQLGIKEKLPFVQHVAGDGTFKNEVTDFAGLKVKPLTEEKDSHQLADIEIIKYLAKHATLFAKEKFIHSYPHCWRCGTPLLNYATSSWFIKVPEIRDEMVAANKGVKWNPEHIGDGRFGKWLENARDWAISRTRYWGAPLPIWQSDDKKETEILGSIDDIRSKIKRNMYTLVRHGEADHNVTDVLSSKTDNPHHLTEKGRAQVKTTAENLKGTAVDIIYASPFIRTKETVELISKELGFAGEIIFDDRLREEGFGSYEGKPFSEFVAYFESSKGTLDRIEKRLPDGESLIDVRERVGEFIYEIDRKYEGKNILIVTHEGIMKMLKALSDGGEKKTLIRMWSGFDMFVDTGSHINLDFVSLPHNEMYELDFHRPYIDKIEWVSASGKLMKRIPHVFDTWYDSGSMPFASRHYPFENKEAFDKGEIFPADYIAEGQDQTRGWFYSLLVLGVGMFNKSPYKHVVVNGLILAEDGRKMSKSLNNYPDLMLTVDKFGADSLRYFLLSSPSVKAEDTSFSEKFLDEVVKKHFNRLYNVLSLYEMYDQNIEPVKSDHVLDVWIEALLEKTAIVMTGHLDRYEFDKATRPIGDFIEELSTWYIRRSRDRFKSEDVEDRNKALSTTRKVLVEFSKLLAPFVPFIAEDLYKKLSAEKESVHLESWPAYASGEFSLENTMVLSQMEEIRRIVSLALEARSAAGIKVRQPLARLMLKGDEFGIADNEQYLNLIKDEVNVKEVILDSAIADDVSLDIILTPELVKEGVAREVMRFVQDMRKKAGLSPKDAIVLTIETNDEGKGVVDAFKDEIMKTARIADILFEDLAEGEALKAENVSFRIRLKKI